MSESTKNKSIFIIGKCIRGISLVLFFGWQADVFNIQNVSASEKTVNHLFKVLLVIGDQWEDTTLPISLKLKY